VNWTYSIWKDSCTLLYTHRERERERERERVLFGKQKDSPKEEKERYSKVLQITTLSIGNYISSCFVLFLHLISSVLIFCSFTRYSHGYLWVSGMWEYSLPPHYTFIWVKTPLEWSWGFIGLMMGFVGLCWGFTPTLVIRLFLFNVDVSYGIFHSSLIII
jgi:hypothetical protein